MERDQNKDLSKDFSLSHDLDDTQKRFIEIDMIRDQQDRDLLRGMEQMAAEKVKIAQQEADRQKEAVIQRELDKRTQAQQQLEYNMKGMDNTKSPQDIEREIRSNVDQQYAPELQAHVQQVEREMDEPVRQELKLAIFRDNQPEVTQEPAQREEPSKPQWWENSAHATQENEQSNASDRGNEWWRTSTDNQRGEPEIEPTRDFNNVSRERDR